MIPYLNDPDVQLYLGDSLTVLRDLPDESVHCIATSPPFFGLRDYGTGRWEGGDESCDHAERELRRGVGLADSPASTRGGALKVAEVGWLPYKDVCGKCGAKRIDQQIGLEDGPSEWSTRLVEIFRECRRVLHKTGTLWIECGDSYAANRGYQVADGKHRDVGNNMGASVPEDLKAKDLIGQAWMLAFALRADGWFLRSCVIWHKPNALPESVRDRPTTGHSYVFLLSKSSRYFYDPEAVREPAEWARWGDQTVPKHEGTATASGWMKPKTKDELKRQFTPQDAAEQRLRAAGGTLTGGTERSSLNESQSTRNMRTVWSIPTQSNTLGICSVCDAYWESGAPRQHCGVDVVQHFAAFPKELVRRMLLAGTSEKGVCSDCGAPWVRELKREFYGGKRTEANSDGSLDLTHGHSRNALGGRPEWEEYVAPETLGWIPSCECDAQLAPARVLDPFAGSSTTALVARSLGRHSVMIELNPNYAKISANRLAQLTLDFASLRS